jgi:hypothetical protein
MELLSAQEQSSSSCALLVGCAGKPDTISFVYLSYSAAINSIVKIDLKIGIFMSFALA